MLDYESLMSSNTKADHLDHLFDYFLSFPYNNIPDGESDKPFDIKDYEHTKHLVLLFASHDTIIDNILFDKFFDKIYSLIMQDYDKNDLDEKEREYRMNINLFSTMMYFKFLPSDFIEK